MNRRKFITLLGSAAAAWPLAASAQQSKVYRLGYLEAGSPSDPVEANLRRQFLLGMRDLGHVEGRHFTMEDRNADGHLDRLPALAAEPWTLERALQQALATRSDKFGEL